MTAEEPTLKCVIALSDRRNLCSLVATTLEAKVGSHSLRRLGDESVIVYDPAPPAEIRDWVSPVLQPDESLLVLEFEKWSGRGAGVHAEWLMRRGH
jgi:hypothetical protein